MSRGKGTIEHTDATQYYSVFFKTNRQLNHVFMSSPNTPLFIMMNKLMT